MRLRVLMLSCCLAFAGCEPVAVSLGYTTAQGQRFDSSAAFGLPSRKGLAK